MCPFSYVDCQKLGVAPSPRVTTVLVLNKCLSTTFTGGSVPTQCLSGETHYHLSPSALLKRSRSSIPRPPKVFGLNALLHFTRQWPPFASSVPFHKKLFLNLSLLWLTSKVWKLLGSNDNIIDKISQYSFSIMFQIEKISGFELSVLYSYPIQSDVSTQLQSDV